MKSGENWMAYTSLNKGYRDCKESSCDNLIQQPLPGQEEEHLRFHPEMTLLGEEPIASLGVSSLLKDISSVFSILVPYQASFHRDANQLGCEDAVEKVETQRDLAGCLPSKEYFQRFLNVASRNHTHAPEFLLLGLTDDPELQPLIFYLFLSMYLVTILGNLLVIMAVISDSHLHTPMYFFLSNLSFTDICISTTTIPKMLLNIQAQNQGITYTGCLTQIVFALVFAVFENFLLAAMAYDRYVAICHPLIYMVIMNPRICVLQILLSLSLSIVVALLHGLMVLQLSFCKVLEIPHFFCELAQVLKFACSDTLINNILIYFTTSLFGIPMCGIIFSYTKIVYSIWRMPSVSGKYKAFSPCGSHLSVVSLFYGTGLGVYISSALTNSSRNTAVASMMYTVIPQVLNPFIYSLRNRDMKGAFRKLISRSLSLL
ncbi:olfactory receptor 7G2-like [Diceros bicornis minor]|uniref:olfactory receptor 7G2-like n=1 Tax=Diceros bicornis minor TaxID=77932 RepID=UPI0026EDE31F|nr:olfactory receptor 7G2-like [Diceros bicornis minor]